MTRAQLQHQTQSRASTSQGPPTAGEGSQDRKIRAGGTSGLVLSHGTSLGPSLGSFSKALLVCFFSSPLLHFPATDNDTNLCNWNKPQTVFSKETFPICSISLGSVHSPSLCFCTQFSHDESPERGIQHFLITLRVVWGALTKALTAFTTVVESDRPYSLSCTVPAWKNIS